MVCDKGHLEWKKMYFKLCRCYPHREQYSDTLHLCTHCHILFWKVSVFVFPLHQRFGAETPEINTANPTEFNHRMCFVFLPRRTQTIRARPTTPKAAPPLCRLKILSTFSTSDSPPPFIKRVNYVYTVHKHVKYYVSARSITRCVFLLRYDCKRLRQRDNYAIVCFVLFCFFSKGTQRLLGGFGEGASGGWTKVVVSRQ